MAEPNSDWWRTWFGPRYLALYDETLTERTPAEIDRLEALLQLRPPRRILDLPCGQGRHAIELARRGYEVTGMDISPYLIEIARQRARAADVQVRWLTGDYDEELDVRDVTWIGASGEPMRIANYRVRFEPTHEVTRTSDRTTRI